MGANSSCMNCKNVCQKAKLNEMDLTLGANSQAEPSKQAITGKPRTHQIFNSSRPKFSQLQFQAIVKIQAFLRGCLARRKFAIMKARIVKTQSLGQNRIGKGGEAKYSKAYQSLNDQPHHTRTGSRNSFHDVMGPTQIANGINSSGGSEKEKAQEPNEKPLKREKRPAHQLSSGAVYEGEWIGNMRDGFGVQIWPDGAKYEGEWRNNKANGKGKFYHIDGDVFDGNWKDDKANGYGVYLHFNGATYKGEWKDDLQHGHGVETWADHSRYEGQYVMGKKHGHGTYEWGDGSKYTGEWYENKINGYGVYVWLDGRKYEGGWQNNNMHGKGKYSWPDGKCYEGEYVNDKKEGYGVYSWPDGRRYEGKWLNGRQHGKAKFVDSTGEVRWGIWENGKRVRWLDDAE